ncbi:MAG TPA: outer membrane lipoprotein-sorting protein [Terracidiphilus sp.]|jgi:hypothetical protein|nr:outer membrane lipoprotein-sorting protein [Terracidiphilus sp.]
MKRRAAIAFLVLFASFAARAADTQPSIETARGRVKTADYRIVGHLVRVEAGGARTSYGVTLKAHWFATELRVLLDVTSPGNAREHVLLTMRPGGQDAIEVARPGDKAATPLPFSQWSEGLLGGDFSYEDFLEPEFFWPSQTVVREEKRGARDCDVVKSAPGPSDRTHYAEALTWLDRTISFPIYAEKTLKGSGVVKEFTYYGLRHDEGVWSASQIEASTRGKPGSTLLVIERGSAKAKLSARDFGTEAMTHFSGGA